MHTYNVHIYRVMRLFFPGTTADTPEAAAQWAAEKPTADAACLDDCDGETRAVLVDVLGDDACTQSRMIRRDPVRDASPEMPKVLEMAAATGYSTEVNATNAMMFVDDTGALTDKPVNEKATALYHRICKPGTTSPIRGDVEITKERYFR